MASDFTTNILATVKRVIQGVKVRSYLRHAVDLLLEFYRAATWAWYYSKAFSTPLRLLGIEICAIHT